MIEQLYAYHQDTRVGTVEWDRQRDQLSFCYDASWRSSAHAYPLSLSMPLAMEQHGDQAISAYLWGLLPDNEATLRTWGKKFGVSPRNVFRMMSRVGEDCAGAIQFVQPDRLESWLEPSNRGSIQWIDSQELEQRVALLLKDHSATRLATDSGYFSLAGAQPKIALHYDEAGKLWGVPSGRQPTTHILKPTTGEYDGFAENEHFCLCLAEQLGCKTASSVIHHIGETPVIVVKRFDRLTLPESEQVLRIHQEDFCQALAVHPTQKYQSEGGPSADQIVEVLQNHSSKSWEDVWRFCEAMAYNWLIMGTDAHAKNFAIMLASRGQVRLAPLYDMISILPYSDSINLRKSKMAMKIGGRYKVEEISGLCWVEFAETHGLSPDELLDRIDRMIRELPDALQLVADRVKQSGIDHPVVDRLVEHIGRRSEHCARSVAAARK